jgi:FkbM family methyltransferase
MITTIIQKVIARSRRTLFPNSFKLDVLTKGAIRRLVGREDAVIFEIGSADGLDSIDFLKVMRDPKFRLICVEPEPQNIKKFLERITDSRTTLFQVAISETDGVAQLNVSSTAYSSSLKQPNMREIQRRWPEISFDSAIDVSTRSLDSIVGELGVTRIDFIWADIQGAEDLLIRGGVRALTRTRFLYTEYGGDGLYFGDNPLEKIQSLLGSSWSLLRDYKTDALFVNHDVHNDQ